MLPAQCTLHSLAESQSHRHGSCRVSPQQECLCHIQSLAIHIHSIYLQDRMCAICLAWVIGFEEWHV